jgi:hypothetical protein
VEQSKALSHKAKPIAFLFKATKMSKTTKKTSKCEKEKCSIDYLLSLGAFTLGLYTQLDSYLFKTLQTDFYLFTTRQRFYLANFIYLNSSLISTWTLTRLGVQSWTLSWLNFFLNSVLKLNRIL